jgi:hypothetical protein
MLTNILFGLLGEYTDKDSKQVMEDASRELWLNADEALVSMMKRKGQVTPVVKALLSKLIRGIVNGLK